MFRTWAVCVVAVFLTGSLGWSSTPYTPPEGEDEWQYITVILKGTEVDKDARGKAILACNMAESQHRAQLSAEKIVPRGTYSVWLVKYDAEKKKIVKQTRVDNPKRRLRADRYGKLAFASNLNSCPQGKYTHVYVRYHADGNPRNTKDAKTALKGALP